MPVSTVTTSFSYKPGAAMLPEAIPFQFIDAVDLVVTHVAAATLVRTPLTDAAYTIAGDGQSKTGRITAAQAWPVNDELIVARRTELVQKANVKPHEPVPAAALTLTLDRTVLAVQEQDAANTDTSARALMVPPGETASELPSLIERIGGAKKILAIDQDTGAIQVEPIGVVYRGNTGPANSTYASLTALRTTANPTNISAILTARGLAGTFAWNPDETRADDGRDVIKSTLSATGAWVRIGDANVIPIQRFFVTGDGSDETAQILAWFAAIRASGLAGLKTRGTTNGVTLKFDVINATFAGAAQIELDFAGSQFIPTTQTGGRIVISGFNDLTISNVRATGYIQRFHIDPVFHITGGVTLRTPNCYFENCGAGFYVGSGIVWNGDVSAKNVGVMPRPTIAGVMGPGGEWFGAGFERYGYVCRGVLLNGGRVTGRSSHDLPAGGASSDVTGGAGHYTSFLCNNFDYDVTSVNSPGQGACHAGSWQGHDILAELDSNTFNNTLPGQNNKIRVKGGGANQELGTLFGVGNSELEPSGSDNRACVGELWECWSCTMTIRSARESVSAQHPISTAGLGGVAGRGAAHCIGCFDCVVEVDISVARYNGLSFGGSRRCILKPSPIRNYGAQNDISPGSSSGVELGIGVYGKLADQITIIFVEGLKAVNNTHGGTIFIQSNAQILYYRGSEAGGPLTIMGGGQSAKGASPDYYKMGLSGGGTAPDAPGWRILPSGGATASSGTTIYTLTPILTPFDKARLIVSGVRVGDAGVRFIDEISAAPGVAGVKVHDQWDQSAGVPTRAYSVNPANGQLRLTSGGDPLKVTVEGTQYVSATLP